jgi:SulP family sulfate permease
MERLSDTRRLQRAYSWRDLRHDVVAGLTVAAVALPQGMAYALIAGLPPQFGLYTAFLTAILGSLLGSSSHLITGPTNAISLVVFSALAGVGDLTGHDPQVKALAVPEALATLTLLVGTIQLGITLLKIGDLTHYISESVVLGFMAGAALLVALAQLPNLLGLEAAGDGHLHVLHRLVRTLREGGPVRPEALALGLGTVVVVVLLRRLDRRLRVPLPDMLLALVAAAAVAAALGWRSPESAEDVPWGLPPWAPPGLHPVFIQRLTGSALAIAVLGLLEALAVAKSVAARTREPLDFNRECLGQGLANLGGSFFQCMPGSGSLTRSAINFQAGAVSRMAGVIAGVVVGLSLLLFSPLAHFVPRPALAGILVVTAWRLVDRRRLLYCLRATRYDAVLALATAGAAVFISIEFAILIGTFLSFLLFVPRAARLHVSELVVTPQRVLRERIPDDPRCTKLVLYALEGELFFGVVPHLDEFFAQLRRQVDVGVRVILLRLKRIRNPDMVCMERLQGFLEDMQDRQVPVLLCGVRDDFARALHNLRFHHWLPQEYVFLEDATLGSSTLKAVHRGYALLAGDFCESCPRRGEVDPGPDAWYYRI